MSLIDGSADGGSIKDGEQLGPVTADGTPTTLGEDHSLVLPANATTAQVPDISRLDKYPRFTATGRLYSEDTDIRPSRQGTDRITDIVLPKHRFTESSVEMVPFENGEDGYDPEASVITVYGDDQPQRHTLKELGNYEMGHSTENPKDLYLASGSHLYPTSWQPDKVFVLGKHEIYRDEDDQEEYEDDEKIVLVDPFITIRKVERDYY